ncbi:hypothetical protein D3C76_750100 [compost metagenome]
MAKSVRGGAVYVVLLVVGVTLGMQLAETGTGSVYGPAWNQVNTGVGSVPAQLPGTAYSTQDTRQNSGVNDGFNAANSSQQVIKPLPSPAELLLPAPAEPAVDRFADKTAHLLQEASRKGIHWFASLFGPSTPSTE